MQYAIKHLLSDEDHMKKLLLSASLILFSLSLYSAENQSFVLGGKNNTQMFLSGYEACKTDFFRDCIDDIGEYQSYQFRLDLPHASAKDLVHIKAYAGVRSAIENDQIRQEMMNTYISKLSGDEMLKLVESARMLFYHESVPLFLLAPLCKRMEQADKTFPYSSLPRKVQDEMLKVLLEKQGFAEKYCKASKYWS
jgi:hypothetical protein